jgi:hypothetical protein
MGEQGGAESTARCFICGEAKVVRSVIDTEEVEPIVGPGNCLYRRIKTRGSARFYCEEHELDPTAHSRLFKRRAHAEEPWES